MDLNTSEKLIVCGKMVVRIYDLVTPSFHFIGERRQIFSEEIKLFNQVERNDEKVKGRETRRIEF